ncbi:MAG: type II/IV secretion system protein, partial [Planctomycetota bacterium]|nr:type II/IV secretion system protein [Planctomycetota bacterium]
MTSRIIKILVDRDLLTSQQRHDALLLPHDDSAHPLDAVVGLGISEEVALRAVGEELGIEFIDLNGYQPDVSLLNEFPAKLVYRRQLFPLARDNGSLVIATSNPFDIYALDQVSASTDKSVQPV